MIKYTELALNPEILSKYIQNIISIGNSPGMHAHMHFRNQPRWCLRHPLVSEVTLTTRHWAGEKKGISTCFEAKITFIWIDMKNQHRHTLSTHQYMK